MPDIIRELVKNISPEGIAAIIALIGVLVSAVLAQAVSLRNSKRQNVVNAVTSNRMGKINDTHDAMLAFMKEYLKNLTPGRYALRFAKAKVELQLRSYRSSYLGLKEQLDICSTTPYSDEDCEKLMIEMQNMLNFMWRRIKQEAGLTETFGNRERDKLVRKIDKEKVDQYSRRDAYVKEGTLKQKSSGKPKGFFTRLFAFFERRFKKTEIYVNQKNPGAK